MTLRYTPARHTVMDQAYAPPSIRIRIRLLQHRQVIDIHCMQSRPRDYVAILTSDWFGKEDIAVLSRMLSLNERVIKAGEVLDERQC